MPTNYAFLSQIPDPATKRALKVLLDRLGNMERVSAAIGTVSQPLTDHLDGSGKLIRSIADPILGSDAVNLQTLKKYVAQALTVGAPTVRTTPTGSGPSPPTPPLFCYTDIAGGQPAGIPAAPNLRWWRGDFCGVDIPGLPPVAGGAASPNTFLSFFLDRYSPADQAGLIFPAYLSRGYTHLVLSWPDSRDGAGQSIAQFVATTQMVQANGLFPAVFLTSKDYDPPDVPTIMAGLNPLLTALVAGGACPIACIGWELSLWLSPTQVQDLIDQITAVLVPGAANCYVHFQQDYIAFQQPGGTTADFWALQVGKLTGLLAQKDLSQNCGLWQARIADGTGRFAGGFGFPTDSGFGHPFDYVAWEYAATGRFSGAYTEATAKGMGQQAIAAPGDLPVMGFGNGCNPV